jgi:hypothetical protein
MGIRPVDPSIPISQNFGMGATRFNPHPTWGNYQPYGHTGIDFATPMNTPVYTVSNGTVVWADWASKLPAWSWEARWYLDLHFPGIVVVIDHGPYLSVYAHLNSTSLNIGDRVHKGNVIGRSLGKIAETGNTGGSTGPHLHFEIVPKPFVWWNNYYGRVNPWPYIQESLIHEGDTGFTYTEPVFELDPQSSGAAATPITIDPLEELMSWYKSRTDFENSLAKKVIDFRFTDKTGKWIWLGEIMDNWRSDRERLDRVERAVEDLPVSVLNKRVPRKGESEGYINLATVAAYERDNWERDRAAQEQILRQQKLIMEKLGIEEEVVA